MTLPASGFAILPSGLNEAELQACRDEAQRLAREAGSACVRHLQRRSELFRQLALSPRLLQFLPEGFIPVRSILFDKTPGENWPVLWHQDLSIALSERVEVEGYGPWSIKDGVPHASAPTALLESMITLRLHLDDTAADNGALCVIPGSHRLGRISADDIAALSANGSEICPCRAGEILKMSPLLVHSSRRSQKLDHRRILHFEYAPQHGLDPRLKWNEG